MNIKVKEVALLILVMVMPEQAFSADKLFYMGGFSLMLPADVIVSNRYGVDYHIYDFRTHERYLFSIYIGGFKTSTITRPAVTETFALDNYPDTKIPYWPCGDQLQWRCARAELPFILSSDGYPYTLQFFYEYDSVTGSRIANEIFKTLQAPAPPLSQNVPE